jgi:hypothetical protein
MNLISNRGLGLIQMRGRLAWGVALAMAYLLYAVIGMQDVGAEFAPDTSSYLEFSPYRQPLYGAWANSMLALLGSWEAVKKFQILLFCAVCAWVIIELAAVSVPGMVASFLLAALLVVLGLLGLLNLVGSLISEGLFFSLLMLMMAMLLAWLRVRRTVVLVGLTLLIVGMGQLRTAALLVVVIPMVAALGALFFHSWRSAAGRSALAVIFALLSAMALFPILLGKSVFHLSSPADSTGLVLLPRVSLLPPTQEVRERSPAWTAMSSSWRSVASTLSVVALTQFDGQLQEAIRYEIAPKVLLPAMLNRSQDEMMAEWQKGTYFDDAKKLAFAWIREEWPTYARLSAAHLWGMMTAANFMDNDDRRQVWAGLTSVADSTWRVASFRTDYPLSRVNEPLSQATSLLYFLIRFVSVGVLILGAVSALKVLGQSFCDREISAGDLAVGLAVGWSIAHSIPAALTIFPEYRYTYANILVMFAGGAVWLAYLGVKRGRATPASSTN